MKVARFVLLFLTAAGVASSSATGLSSSRDGRIASAEAAGVPPPRPPINESVPSAAIRDDVLARLFHATLLVSAASDESLAFVISETLADRLQTRAAILEFEEVQASRRFACRSIAASSCNKMCVSRAPGVLGRGASRGARAGVRSRNTGAAWFFAHRPIERDDAR